jgi:hypothetical protein
MEWSYFKRKKGELIENTMRFIKALKAQDPNTVKFVPLDNAGEN